MEARFKSFLKSISLDKNAYTLLIKLIKEEFDKIDKDSAIEPKHFEKIKNLETKLEKIQDLYIDGQLNKEECLKAKERYQNLFDELKQKEKQLAKNKRYSKCTKRTEINENL